MTYGNVHKSSGWLRSPSHVIHTTYGTNLKPSTIRMRYHFESSGWFTENFVMSSTWLSVASYVIRMRYHIALSDPDDLLHCQLFKWLTHMILKLPRILAFRITGPLWRDPPVMFFFAVCLVVILNKLLNKQSSYWWFQTPCRSNVVNQMLLTLCLDNRNRTVVILSFSAPMSFWQLPGQSMTKSS